MELNNNDKGNTGDDSSKTAGSYARYSGIAFQMIAIIGVFSFIGYRIDKWNNSGQLLYTALLGLAGVIIALYQVIRSLKKPMP